MKAARYNELRDQYRAALGDYVSTGGEDSLERAYAIGRAALNDGLDLFQVAALHHDAMQTLLSDPSGKTLPTVKASEIFFTECLSPFEMALRGFREANAALCHLNEALEQEARRIAHALHDEVGQILTSIHLGLETAAHKLPPSVGHCFQEIRGLLNHFGDTVRQLSHELRPTALDDLGLVPALQYLARGFSSRAGVVLTVEGNGVGRLAPPIEIGVYRIVQEALNNVVRHAQASSVSVCIRIEHSEKVVRCAIRDNGVGFDVAEILARPGRKGLGLLGMRERAEALGGTLQIASRPGRGTECVVTIPLEG